MRQVLLGAAIMVAITLFALYWYDPNDFHDVVGPLDQFGVRSLAGWERVAQPAASQEDGSHPFATSLRPCRRR